MRGAGPEKDMIVEVLDKVLEIPPIAQPDIAAVERGLITDVNPASVVLDPFSGSSSVSNR
ncbi:MAG: hypothetical protein AAFO89_05460 [Planctomycetota bacterium]